jgi:predicted alpha/beta hydrolase family esterase
LIRYITGRGGNGIGGLSTYLATLDDDFDVLPIDPEFLLQDIQGQVDSTREFINLESGNVIANSYGAYLLLLSLIDQPPLPVRTLLLSPVLGRAISEERMLFSRPPREKTLHQAIAEQRLGVPNHMEIVTGAEDKICDPALARRVGEQLGISLSILPNEGHMLEPSSVERALRRFLQE